MMSISLGYLTLQTTSTQPNALVKCKLPLTKGSSYENSSWTYWDLRRQFIEKSRLEFWRAAELDLTLGQGGMMSILALTSQEDARGGNGEEWDGKKGQDNDTNCICQDGRVSASSPRSKVM